MTHHDPAFAAVLAAQDGLIAFVRSQLRREADVDDVLQEVWVALTQALRSGQPPESPVAWCRMVARNRIVDRWRRAGREPAPVDLRLLDLSVAAFAEHAQTVDLRAERIAALRRCLAGLAGRARALVEAFHLEGLSAAEVAARFGGTASAVLMALSRARRVLAGCVERSLREVAP